MTSVDLFAGPGGIDLPGRSIGVEWDANAVATRIAAGLPTVHGDVRDYGPADFPEATRLTGGPPCQTFTVAGSGSGRAALNGILSAARDMAARRKVSHTFGDERTGLVLEPLRWALTAVDMGRPYETILLEQVQQVQQVWDEYAVLLAAEGYHVATGVLRTEQYGVPQTRRRSVLLARLDGPVVLPAATHRPYRKGVPQQVGDPDLLPWVSMGEVLDRPGAFEVISNYGTGGDPKNRGRRASFEPAATVTGKVSRSRIVDLRGAEQPRFSSAEAGVLQSFPADYPWSGSGVAQQIGNACPPVFARVLHDALSKAPALVPAVLTAA
ncbi:DNA cytosine methyltransferase [Streptomyces sp. CS090A]|uniref:DNA cytosine methyltransferase n=1 Tax=Streptomyces sp. CS090A TaxID=2162710 RepID=UPI000D516F31|nr:DNA cytosine methyltransferase [Streptomyces sp. CS090A]PVC80578.1 DNA cytosine methyltransferase [Streptomyces sp. CS090A]